jgi:hypothetical protein
VVRKEPVVAKSEKKYKKGDKVKYRAGKAGADIKAVVVRSLKAGSKVPTTSKLQSTKKGEECTRDSLIVELDDGTQRLISAGYVK